MGDADSEPEIAFSKKVDRNGRLVVPQEHRQVLEIDDREALVKFTAQRVAYLDDDDGGDE